MHRSPQLFLSRLFLTCALAAGGLTACVGNPFDESGVDPTSPVAADVARLARANTDYPTFSELPAKPTDVRPLRAFGQAAREVNALKADIERRTAENTWTLNNTEAFAAAARVQAGPELEPAARTDTEAFAAEGRARATPPPPLVR